MQLQPQTVTCAVEEARPASAPAFRGIAVGGEKFLHRFVHRGSFGPGLNCTDGQTLCGTHRVPELALGRIGASSHHGTGQVTKVAGARVARKNIKNDQFMGPQPPVSAFVGIARLPPARHNRSLGNAARAKHGSIGLGAHYFTGQGFPFPLKQAGTDDLGLAQDLDRALQPDRGEPRGAANRGQFALILHLALRPKMSFDRNDTQTRFFQHARGAEWEVRRHIDTANFTPEQKTGGKHGRRVAAEFAGEFRSRDHLVDFRFAPAAVDLKIIEHNGFLAAMLEEKKRIRSVETGGIKHVGRPGARRIN